MRRVWAAILPILASAAPSRAAGAQWLASVDLGASHLRQTGIPESVAQTLGATVDALGDHGWLHTAALSSLQPASSAWTGQALALGGIFGPITTISRWEVGGALSGFAQTGASVTTSGELNGRVRFGGAMGGVALGAGTGFSARDAADGRIDRGSVEAWWGVGHERLFATVIPTRAESISYTDLGLGWRHDATGVSFGAGAGVRISNAGGGWQGADAQLWVAPRIALVLGAGNALADIVRGTPSTRYVSAAIRIGFQPHSTLWPTRLDSRGVRIVVTKSASGTARIDVTVRDANRVELMADFTGWAPVPLERSDNGWFIERAIAPGPHRLALRVDGGEWAAPSNLPRLQDELGGTFGLITVP